MKKSQTQKLLELLSDYRPHSTFEILKIVYGGEHYGVARISARVLDLKKKGYNVKGFDDKIVKSKYWYQLENKREQLSWIN